MIEPASRPEDVIRHYLEARKGPVEAHIGHLKQTFEVDDLSPKNLVLISEALAKARIKVDPPLEKVPQDGRLRLSIMPQEQAGPKSQGRDPKQQTKVSKGQKGQGRKSAIAPEPAVAEPQEQAQGQQDKADTGQVEPNPEHAQRSSVRRRKTPAREQRTSEREQPPAGGKSAPPPDQNGGKRRGGSALRQLLRSRPTEGPSKPEEEAASPPGEPAAKEALAAIAEMLSKLEGETERSLKQSSDLLSGLGAAGEELDARLANLDASLGVLDEELHSLSEADGPLAHEFAKSGERSEQLSRESLERIAATGDALEKDLAEGEWREGVRARLGELNTALRELLDLQERLAAEVAQGEQDLEQAAVRATGARAEVETILSDPSMSEHLEARVASLREAETAHSTAQHTLARAREGFKAGLGQATARVSAAHDQLGATLSDRPDPALPLRARLGSLGKAQSEAIEPVVHELGALSSSLVVRGQRVGELRAPLHQARQVLRTKGTGVGPQQIEAAIAANEAALQTLGSLQELVRTSEAAAANVVQGIEEREERIAYLSSELKQSRSDAESASAELQRTEQLSQRRNSELSARVEEAEQALKQGQDESEAARSRAEKAERQAAAQVAQAVSQLEVVRTDLQNRVDAREKELEQARAHGEDASRKSKELSLELDKSRSEFERQIAERQEELNAALAEAESVREHHSAVTRELEEAQVARDQHQTELRQRETELERARSEGQAAAGKAADVAGELEKAKAALERGAEDAKAARADVSAAQRQRAVLAEELRQTKGALDKHQAYSDAARSRAEGAEAESQTLKQGRTELERELRAMKADLEQRAGQMEGLRAEGEAAASKTVTLSKELEDMGAELKQARSDAKAAQRRSDKQRTRAHQSQVDLQRRLELSEVAVGEREVELEAVRSESQALAAQVEELEKRRAEAGELVGELERVRAEHEGVVGERARLSEELERSEAAVGEREVELEAVRSEGQALAARIEELEKGRAEAGELAGELERVRAEREGVVGERARLSEELKRSEAEREVELERARAEAKRAATQAAKTEGGEQPTKESPAVTATAKATGSSELEQKLAERETELDRVTRQLREAHEQLGQRRGERRKEQESGVLEAVDSVRRALQESMDLPETADLTKDRSRER